jgi:hypothetical protein
MRIKRRPAVTLALASAAALAVGGIAFANHTSNVSSLPEFKFTPSTAPKTAFVNGQLLVHTHTTYAHPHQRDLGGFTNRLTLHFDNDFQLNLTGIPSCTASFTDHTTIAQAWEQCGPGADTAPEVNAYLSPPTAVSGKASTAPPSNWGACVLVFKRSSSPDRLLLFFRLTGITNATVDCSSPATNASGSATGTLTATLGSSGIADFGKKLTIPFGNYPVSAYSVDDFRVTLKRGGFVKGRCYDANKIWNVRGIFDYSAPSAQPADTVNKTQTCAVG